MSEFGYIPEAPEQSFGNNKGIFTPKDIYDLTRADKYTNYGQLELIETQTVSSNVATLSFDSIKENTYNVHFCTYSNFKSDVDNRHLGLRFKVNGTTTTGFDYKAAMQRNTASTGVDLSQGNDTKIWLAYNTGTGTGESLSGYFYMYNAGDSTKYTFLTAHNIGLNRDPNTETHFLSGVRDEIGAVDGIEFKPSGDNIASLDVSLYGIKEYS
jgi:hypothetical protein